MKVDMVCYHPDVGSRKQSLIIWLAIQSHLFPKNEFWCIS